MIILFIDINAEKYALPKGASSEFTKGEHKKNIIRKQSGQLGVV